MKTERLNTHTRHGRRVAIWRSTPEKADPGSPIVILNAGFARRMRNVVGIAWCLVRNGALVYRFDSIDHLGLSDGDIGAFTFTGMAESLRAAVGLARSVEGRRTVRVVALRLA